MQILARMYSRVIIYIYIYIYYDYSRSIYNVRGIIIKLLFLRWNDTTRVVIKICIFCTCYA